MKNIEETDKRIAFLIANTKRKKRPNNLIEIAENIEWLQSHFGRLKKVSDIIGISTEMLKKFLSVKELSPQIQKLIREEKIDSVSTAHLMKKFDEYSQLIIAKEVIAGNLNVDDMKVLVPLSKKLSNLKIRELIQRVISSKDIKVYLIFFFVPENIKDKELLKHKFSSYVDNDEIIIFKETDGIITLGLSKTGIKKLRIAAKENNLTLRKYMNKLIND